MQLRKIFLDDLSNSGPAVRQGSEGRELGPPEDRYIKAKRPLNTRPALAGRGASGLSHFGPSRLIAAPAALGSGWRLSSNMHAY